jgi:hypothetical protein
MAGDVRSLRRFTDQEKAAAATGVLEDSEVPLDATRHLLAIVLQRLIKGVYTYHTGLQNRGSSQWRTPRTKPTKPKTKV